MKKTTLISFALASTLFASSFIGINETYAKFSEKDFQDLQKKKDEAQVKLNETNTELTKYKEVMAKADAEIKKVQIQIQPVEVELKKAEDKQKIVEDKYNKMMTDMYASGEFSPLATLLKAEDFDDFVNRFELLRILAEQRYDILKEHKVVTEQVKKKMGELKGLQDLQQKEIDKAKVAYNELLKQQSKDKASLAELEQIEEEHQDELIEINKDLIDSGKLHFAYTGPFMKPVNGAITSPFGYRTHPIYKRKILHKGIDFAGAVGTPIYAPADGVVVESRASSGYGWLVTVYHGDKNGSPVYSRFAHSYPRQVLVKVGQTVTKGEQITSIGNNGNTTGPHLHYEVLVGNSGQAVNPMNFIK